MTPVFANTLGDVAKIVGGLGGVATAIGTTVKFLLNRRDKRREEERREQEWQDMAEGCIPLREG
jgi:hypothetical protein